ncbi:MAG: hypothetical protein KBF13_00095 [Prevotella sp.]|nr:hypothetical protein [Prevotella sp.]
MNILDYQEELKKAILIRQFETRLLQLFAEGKINGTVHTCVGEELNGVMLSKYVNEDDVFLSNHRGHGHFISKTGKVNELLAEMMGRETGISHGFGGSQHLFTHGFISNGVQGGMTPVAAGIALSFKLSKKNNIAVSFLGDGTMGEGIIYESFNIVSKWGLPVLYVLENNHYAQSTSNKETWAGSIAKRAEGFGLEYYTTNVWDLDSMNSVIKDVVEKVRTGQPCLLEIDCYRLNSHSKGDDNRNPEEVAEFKAKDLINTFKSEHSALYEEMEKAAKERIEEAYQKALNDDVLSKVDNPVLVKDIACKYLDYENTCKVRGGESIHQALLDQFAKDEKAIIIGEDIRFHSPYTGVPYGGAFKVTKELSDLYPDRVRNTPISEQAITGIGIGLALMEYKPLTEIMFGDFMTLTFDQLQQHASKFVSMYGRNVDLPYIVRTPMGGRRGYGPTHSQSIEKHFLGIPNVEVLAINNAIEPGEIYKTLFEQIKRPTIVIENKILYTHIGFKTAKGFKLKVSDETYPTVVYRPDSSVTNVTVVCYGGMLEIVKEVIEELAMQDIICEVVSPTMVCPLNIRPIIDSVEKSHKLLVVEEGGYFASWGSEVCAALLEKGCKLDRVVRMGNNGIIPCSLPAENDLLPNAEQIKERIKSMI